jgi:hypothetical protein
MAAKRGGLGLLDDRKFFRSSFGELFSNLVGQPVTTGAFTARHIGGHSIMVGVQTMRLFVFWLAKTHPVAQASPPFRINGLHTIPR